MNALLLTVTVLVSAQPDCPTATLACYNEATNTVKMQPSPELPAGKYRMDLPPNLVVPHFSSRDFFRWTRCGEAIAQHNGLDVAYNRARTLCHEIKHAMGHDH